jgi:Tfp pilus assembly protein PilE
MRSRLKLIGITIVIVFMSVLLPIAARIYCRYLRRKDRRRAPRSH